MSHAAIAIAAQLLTGWVFGRWLLGGLLLSFFYLGREIAQAEYRWISEFGEGRRANMPFWGGFDPAVWNFKSVMDVLLPFAATILLYMLVLFVQRRRALAK